MTRAMSRQSNPPGAYEPRFEVNYGSQYQFSYLQREAETQRLIVERALSHPLSTLSTNGVDFPLLDSSEQAPRPEMSQSHHEATSVCSTDGRVPLAPAPFMSLPRSGTYGTMNSQASIVERNRYKRAVSPGPKKVHADFSRPANFSYRNSLGSAFRKGAGSHSTYTRCLRSYATFFLAWTGRLRN